MKILSIVGARPQFVKAAALSRRLRQQHQELLVHTGQHYDYQMSGIFFDGLDLPEPEINLGVGSGSHGEQTGKMLQGLEEVLLAQRPEYVVVYGDTNSTLAGALAAAKLHIPVAHVEAGLRSFDRRMPEEINRLVADHLSTLLLCPSEVAVRNLAAEGITRQVHIVGDVMLDVLSWAQERAQQRQAAVLAKFGLQAKNYSVATVHRSENTDDRKRFSGILQAFNNAGETIVFPVHPRSRKVMTEVGFRSNERLQLVVPLGYLDMIALVSAARVVLTDSGGLQKEAYWLGIPCITLRQQTEWLETVEAGWNQVVGWEPAAIQAALRSFRPPEARPPLYGGPGAAERCVELLSAQQAG